MVHEFDFKGTKYGYKNLFELKTRSRFYGMTGTFRKPVKPGDSGAWVFKAGTTGTDWLGVVVAGDGPSATRPPLNSLLTGSNQRRAFIHFQCHEQARPLMSRG
jgi:hypothetical protein